MPSDVELYLISHTGYVPLTHNLSDPRDIEPLVDTGTEIQSGLKQPSFHKLRLEIHWPGMPCDVALLDRSNK